jgi:uncharacterized membrane protein YcfT
MRHKQRATFASTTRVGLIQVLGHWSKILKKSHILAASLFAILAIIVVVNSRDNPQVAAAYEAGGIAFVKTYAMYFLAFFLIGLALKAVKHLRNRPPYPPKSDK